jgi:hypothetical protein
LVASLIVNNEEHLLRALADMVPAAASFLRHIPQPHSSKQMTIIQQPEEQWVVSLLQLKLEYACDIFTPRIQPQETNFLGISCR